MEYKKMDTYIGNELYKARVIRRITQEQMTAMINEKSKSFDITITRQTYSNYEHGLFSIPQGILEVACNLLGLDWRKVFTDAVDYMKEETLK